MKWIIIVLLFLIFSLFGLGIWGRSRHKKINPKDAKTAIEKIKKIKGSPSEQILKSHSVLVQTLKPLYPDLKSAGEIMQKISPRLKNQKAYWRFHALRNRVAHESDASPSKKEAEQAKQVFVGVIKDLS